MNEGSCGVEWRIEKETEIRPGTLSVREIERKIEARQFQMDRFEIKHSTE